MKGESGRSVGPAAEVAQKLRHVVVVLRLRLEPHDNPVEQFGIGAIEQSFDPFGLSLAMPAVSCSLSLRSSASMSSGVTKSVSLSLILYRRLT